MGIKENGYICEDFYRVRDRIKDCFLACCELASIEVKLSIIAF
jgi:hypothetical protein